MSAIPVPVHFDGHNINIITEDSPSTCKNRIKGMKYAGNKASQNTKEWRDRRINNIQNGKYHNLNTMPFPKKSPSLSSDQASPTPNKMSNDTLIVSPITDANSENIDYKQQETPIQTKKIAYIQDDMKETSPLSDHKAPSSAGKTKIKSKLNPTVLPWTNHPSADDAKDEETDAPKKQQSVLDLPLPPPRNEAAAGNNNDLYKINPALAAQGALASAPRNMRCSLAPNKDGSAVDINQQNKQLLEAGLDPAEFGSHDDVGFDDEESGKQDRQNLYKTELCREWSTSGWCYYNKRCSFAHGLQELRPVFRSKKWRTKRCRNWHTTGYCPYEHRCQFLHDQSPPRRISDYATANARALVAAQQRMQPLYFHYQVEQNRDDATDDENAERNPKEPSPGVINAPLDARVGPRLRRQQMGRNTAQKSKYQMVKKNSNTTVQNKSSPPRSARRSAETPPRKALLNKKHKEPVITPFNPISEYNDQQQNYDIAAQQLGMYNPHQVPTLGALPPLPTTIPMTAYNPVLPTSIDPSLYLSLTPSPPNSPGPQNDASHQAKQPLNPEGLNVDVPVSLTPSPSSLAINSSKNNQAKLAKNQQDMEALNAKIQQLATGQLASQANIAALMQRGGDVNSVNNKATTPRASLDGLMLQALLPNDEFVELQKRNGKNKDANKLSLKPSSSVPNDGKTSAPIPPIPPPLQLQTSINSVVNGAVDAAMTPSTRLIPMTPTLSQTQTSNEKKFSFGNANESIPNTVPSKAANAAPALSSAAALTTGTVDPNQYLLASQPTAYSQQAHAHAHAYAAAHAHVASAAALNPHYAAAYGQAAAFPALQSVPLNGVPLQQVPLTGLQYPFYAASPEFADVPQTTFYQTHYNPPPRHNRY